ncbi:hypothetical protein PQC07_gp209 [Aeromonas phage D3]|uniref:Uncharacterized protein n=1 Tax=Aeromonas phage D3 TaxID=2593327 RepID=A0A514TVN5_9CAUD|nr:hypothetical protein PQC07_gp209 [Aeromonas phage D3]QDJ97063.1 hypothetical protein D3_0066 [Aeromonas phage D3]
MPKEDLATMKNLKEVDSQSLIDALKSRGYEVTKKTKKTTWERIQEHLHREPPEFPKTTGASGLRPKVTICRCNHILCDRCFPRNTPTKCRCKHALCPLCNL